MFEVKFRKRDILKNWAYGFIFMGNLYFGTFQKNAHRPLYQIVKSKVKFSASVMGRDAIYEVFVWEKKPNPPNLNSTVKARVNAFLFEFFNLSSDFKI